MQTQQKKNIFALIAGILLIVGGLLAIGSSIGNLRQMAAVSGAAEASVISLIPILMVDVVLAVAGVMLLLEKRKIAAILILVYAGLSLLSVIISLFTYISIKVPFRAVSMVIINNLLGVAAPALAAVALLKGGKKGMILAIIGGGIMFLLAVFRLPAAVSGTPLPPGMKAGYWFSAISSLFLAGAFVLAGLYLKGVTASGAAQPAAPQGYYPQQAQPGYYPQRGQPGYYPSQAQPGYYPPQGRPQQPPQGYYPPQAQPGYYPPQGQSAQPQQRNYPPQQ